MMIRLATSADAWDIARVHVLSWQTGYRGLVSDSLLDGLSIERGGLCFAGTMGHGNRLGAPQCVHRRLRADAFPDATLWVVDGNQRALRFYRKHGWEHDGAWKVEEWDGAVLNEIRLRRTLK